MKSFFIKIFMVFAAALCMMEGLVLTAFGTGRLPPERLLAFYSDLLAAPKALTAISGVGLFFVLLGFILLIISSRTKPVPPMIVVEKDGKALNIPQTAIRNFITHILEQNPYATDISVDFERQGTQIEIRIATALSGVSSIYQELSEIEAVLKTELERVFEWKGFKFNFHLRGVSVDPRKKFFSSGETEIPPEAAEKADGAGAVIELKDDEEKSESPDALIESGDDAPIAKSKIKGKRQPAGNSFLSKMLWGK